jgi:hypothetical protein
MSAVVEARDGAREAPAPDRFVLRVLAFLGLAVGVNLWLDHHEGLRLANSSAISMLVAAVAGALGLACARTPWPSSASCSGRRCSSWRGSWPSCSPRRCPP